MSGNTVWLASYPKSGNTWWRAVYSAWRSGGAPQLAALGTIAASRQRFDEALGIASSDLTPEEIERLRPLADDAVDERHEELRLEKIHDRLSTATGGQIVSVAATAGALYIVRDPRDVAVSLAHHYDRSVDWAVALLNAPGATLVGRTDDIGDQLPQTTGSWSEHVISWVDEAPFPVHVFRYEDCLADPVKAFTTGFRAAGFEVDTRQLVAAVERASFANLADAEAISGFPEARSRNSAFFRQGKAGSWREELRPDLAEQIEVTHHAVMARFGYATAEQIEASADQ